MLHCQPGCDRAKSTSTFLHVLLSSPERALIGWHTAELTPSLSYHWHDLALLQGDGIPWAILLQRDREKRLAHQIAIWLLAIATIFLCYHAEHRRVHWPSTAAEQSISKLAVRGWYSIAKSPKTASLGPTGLKEAVYAPYPRRRRRAGPESVSRQSNSMRMARSEALEMHCRFHRRCL